MIWWRTSAAARFYWRPDGKPAAAPDVTVAGAGTKTLAPLRAAATVTAVSADRMTLTLSASLAASSRGLVGSEGVCILDMGADGVHEVVVDYFATGTTVVLSTPLPGVSSTAAGTLDWNVWYADFTAGEVGAAVNRGALWSVPWTRDLGTDHPGEPDHDSGVLHIVHRPPHTGLDDRRLLAHVPGLRQRTPTGASGWADVRDIGFEMLVERLRETVLTTAQHVDQLDCTQFARCHALYAASVVLDGQAAGGFGGGDGETWRERADKCVDAKATNLLWLDADDDGAVDSGETGAAGGTLADFTRSLWTSDSTNFDSTEWTVASGVRRGVRDDR